MCFEQSHLTFGPLDQLLNLDVLPKVCSSHVRLFMCSFLKNTGTVTVIFKGVPILHFSQGWKYFCPFLSISIRTWILCTYIVYAHKRLSVFYANLSWHLHQKFLDWVNFRHIHMVMLVLFSCSESSFIFNGWQFSKAHTSTINETYSFK
jgi:hypothetical protein